MMLEKMENILLDIKKYWKYTVLGVLALAALVVGLLNKESATLKKIDDIVDDSKDKMSDIKISKKEVEIRSEIKKRYVEEEREEKLRGLKEIRNIEDRMKRLASLTKFYAMLNHDNKRR